MGKMELEVKVLNIDEKAFKEKLESLGATFIEESKQVLYTYDLATSYGRYMDILNQINNKENEVKLETAYEKLRLLFFDLDNLFSDLDREELKKIIDDDNILNILLQENKEEILNKKELIDFIQKFNNNASKWIRLRTTNNKTTLTVKHILKDNGSGIQQMMESEVVVNDFEAANNLLEALGFSHKCYQEKKRITYKFLDHMIEIDTWPMLPTYFEVEGEDIADLENILGKLGYNIKDTISCTADEIYLNNGIIVNNMRELKFDN